MSAKWNPWFVLYAEVNDRTPQEQYDYDSARHGWPSIPYSRWIMARWGEYRAEKNIPDGHRTDRQMQEDFSLWLATRYDSESPLLENQRSVV